MELVTEDNYQDTNSQLDLIGLNQNSGLELIPPDEIAEMVQT
jgi:hypothetical protein